MNSGLHVEDVKGGISRSEWRLLLPLLYTILVSAGIFRGIGITNLIWPPIILFGLLVSQHFDAEWILWWSVGINAITATGYVLVVRRRRGGHFGEFLAEEERYRLGSERWSSARKAGSCLLFGVTRVGKFFYPVSAIFTTALTGAAYLQIYRKAGLEGVLRVRYTVLNVLVYAQKLFVITFLLWICIN